MSAKKSASSCDFLSGEALNYTINHVFLPPDTPQQDDTDIAHEHDLVRALLTSTNKLSQKCSISESRQLEPVSRMLQLLMEVKPGVEGNTKRTITKGVIRDLKDGECAVFHIRAQNAGLLLTGQRDKILIEAFELLAPNEDVTSCIGRLIREFPDCAATVDRVVMVDGRFLDEFVDVLCKLELQVSPFVRTKSRKSGHEFNEDRDTDSPILVTDMVMGTLAGLGQSVGSQRIVKRSREQVSWQKARLPFHRSPMWLLLRVALRLVLDRNAARNGQKSLYKTLITFHHGMLLQQAMRRELGSNLRFTMAAKLCRRLAKISPQECTPWIQELKEIIAANQVVLQRRWEKAQTKSLPRIIELPSLRELNFAADINLQLNTLEPHLSWVRSRNLNNNHAVGPGDNTVFLTFPAEEVPAFPTEPAMEKYALLSLESWVESNMPLWLAKCLLNVVEVGKELRGLKDLMTNYYIKGSTAYKDNPEALSLLYLDLMDLWIAMDRIAGKAVPLLLEYNPGFTPGFLEPLLLPARSQMARLCNIEAYLADRKKSARDGYPNAFAHFGTSKSFANRYFESSVKHQKLWNQILDESRRTEAEKFQEFHNMRRTWEKLTAESTNVTHTEQWNDYRGGYICIANCKRCRLGRQIDALKIDIFEWPLPENEKLSKAIVFELAVPEVVAVWRDITTHLFHDVFRDSAVLPTMKKLWKASEHTGLKRFVTASSRIQVASDIKPVEASHYRGKHISMFSNAKEVSVRPGWGDYDYYEPDSRISHFELFEESCVPQTCSFAQHQTEILLSSWTRNTKHTSNAVIAAQSVCPSTMSLEEFRAFGHVRSDHRLQWANVLCQLMIPSLNWNNASTYWLVLQACLEAGPSDHVDLLRREAHADLSNENFVRRLVDALNKALDRYRENWQNDVAVSLLTCLATRILSLTNTENNEKDTENEEKKENKVETKIDNSVDNEHYDTYATGFRINLLLGFLSRARQVPIIWARQLLQRRACSNDDNERKDLDMRILMAALSCMSSFDFEPNLLREVLHSANDLSIFVEAAIIAHDHMPPTGSVFNPILLVLSQRWQRIMYRSQESLRTEILREANIGFHQAIHRFWVDYPPSTRKWSALPRNKSHILSTVMKSGDGEGISITFNTLDGRLLVNGNPLSRLPPEYTSMATYKEVFGSQILEVMPSTREGMCFSACRNQHEWVMHFTMIDSELVIQAVHMGGSSSKKAGLSPRVCEFIPSWKLRGDVPVSFIQGYSHWLDLATGVVEFRPKDKRWDSSENNWLLAQDEGRYILSQGRCYVADPHSPTVEALFARLEPLEAREHLDITFYPDHHALVVDLPRFSISFSLAEGDTVIKSKHYSGMCIDDNQNIGTLIGLQSKLVLREISSCKHCTPRRIMLVPRGSLSSNLASNHVEVSVNVSADPYVKHDAYVVDAALGRITSSGSLSGKLYLCHLHALTSHCLPDPLTGRSGTEEALRVLQSASVRSFQQLDQESYNLLRSIAEISPLRRFYPEHLRKMEDITWSHKLPVLSQHDRFRAVVEDILNHARDCELLHLRDKERSCLEIESNTMDQSSPILLKRAKIRNSAFRVSEFGAEEHTTSHDRCYVGRHQKQGYKTFTKARMVTQRLLSGQQDLLDPPSSKLREDILEISGKQFLGDPEVDLRFNLDYLQPSSESLSGLWCGLHHALTKERNKYRIAFFLSALIHAKASSWDVVQTLMAFAIVPDRFGLLVAPPLERQFNLEYEISTMLDRVDRIIQESMYKFPQCPEVSLPKLAHESKQDASRRRTYVWKDKSDGMAKSFRSKLEAQWCQGWTVTTPTGDAYSSYMNVNTIMREVSTALDHAKRTSLFKTYLSDLIRELNSMVVSRGHVTDQNDPDSNGSILPSKAGQLPGRLAYVGSDLLFSRSAPPTNRPRPVDFRDLCTKVPHATNNAEPLTGLFEHLSRIAGDKPDQVSYLQELQNSSASTTKPSFELKQGTASLESIFQEHLLQCKRAAERIRTAIDETLSAKSIVDATFQAACLYPRISPGFLLGRLRQRSWMKLSDDWRNCLVNYGLTLTYLQRAERLVNASSGPERRTELLREILNTGSHECEDGDPLAFPEKLLLELEQGILIRPVQQGIAAKMREPPNGSNSVMQLNMGEGKSSVIVPIVAAALADGERLVRVVVAKPQSKQMQHTLVATLGGLIDRRIFYLPISRALQLGSDGIEAVRRIISSCRKERGVLLVQPEHILSFKLMGLESIYGQSGSLGTQILTTYREFESVSRDIVDESDENFSVKFELIYTIGAQQPIDMSPERWTMIQELMDIVLEVARNLATGQETIKGLLFEEDDTTNGRFPAIRILEDSAGAVLIKHVAEQICCNGLRGFPIQHQSKRMRQAVLEYILQPNLTLEQIEAVEGARSGLFSEPASKNALLLLRGLLATNVISFALGQKRFRVNYGLAPNRRPATKLAVPYRAKDSPAPRSEFSHPDVVIVLTCLSYYYQGLSSDKLRDCLEILSRSDQAEQEYSRWAAKAPDLPSSLGHFSGVNLRDSTLYKESVFPALRYSKPAIDFYLATVVFPKEMREFPYKLSASGWDLGKTKRHPLTGFSGTSDSKYVLPLSVTALDLEEQRHTNSAVLACLLRDENTVLELGGDGANSSSALTVDTLLTAVTTSRQKMRVILDVGAQIIELSNLEVAQRWLWLVPHQHADAVIFFNDHDELSVLTRNGSVDLFLTSPFATQTERCLVFLDQAHTRGTDLRLPDSYRAAVTLGPNLVKDTLVQACMRMRKLGVGQSVTFCVSPEMQKRTRTLANVADSRPLTVSDILVCAIVETWDDAHRSLPLWATQGIRHQYQEIVWERAEETGELSVADVEDYLEDEAQGLEQRYRPISKASGASNSQSLTSKLIKASELEDRRDQVSTIKNKCVSFGLANLDAIGSLQEEQERELAPEVERERQVERPPPHTPAQHELHANVILFAISGYLKPESTAFCAAFHTLATTSAAVHFPAKEFPSELLATADFARTVRTKDANGDEASSLDAYQRPVQWLLTTRITSPHHGMRMVLISSWEANKLKAILESAEHTTAEARPPVLLRAYLPRSSLSFESLEDLTVYTVPRLASTAAPPPPKELVTQLNLFAGQLYLRTYDDYVRLCRFLGLSYSENEGDDDIAADGFVGRGAAGGAGADYGECKFEQSPVGFLSVLFKRIRKDCLDIEKTHMGRVLAGEILRECDFEGNEKTWKME